MFFREETFLNATPVRVAVADAGDWPGMTVSQFLDEFENFPLTDEELEALIIRF